MTLTNNHLPVSSVWVRRRPLLAWSGLVFLCLAGAWLLWRPVWSEVAALPGEQSWLAPKQQLKADIDLLNKLKTNLAAVNQDDLARLKLVLPTGQDLPNLVAQLDGLAKKNKFEILTIDFVSAVEDTPAPAAPAAAAADEPKLLNINLSLSAGNYEQLKSFIADLESSLRLLGVTGINFSYGSTNTSRNGYQINLVSPYLTAN